MDQAEIDLALARIKGAPKVAKLLEEQVWLTGLTDRQIVATAKPEASAARAAIWLQCYRDGMLQTRIAEMWGRVPSAVSMAIRKASEEQEVES